MEYLGGAMYKEYFNELKRCIDLLDVNEIERRKANCKYYKK